MREVLLVGNPNCGKTTLFNALTGARQRVGNWPGVTVEKKTGECEVLNQSVTITDLPGVYSLDAIDAMSEDEAITAAMFLRLDDRKNTNTVLLNIVDACHLERHLYLTSQLLALKHPMVVVLNMMDVAKARGITIDIKALSQRLGCAVIPIEAHKNIGIAELKSAMLTANISAQCLGPTPQDLESGQDDKDADIMIADARYQAVHNCVQAVQKSKLDFSDFLTAKIDKVVLHRYWALPIFFSVMYLMFMFAINIGGAFQDFFDLTATTLFIDVPIHYLTLWHTPPVFIALIANGIGRGMTTTLTFIPVMAAMYFFLSLLESSGYMARAAFVVDKIMRSLGLPGKAFVPMIVGFGCNVPAIMAARTLDSTRDKWLTVLMSPFMSCSARLAIYAVFVAAFFPTGGQNIVFGLYFIGIAMAVFTGWLLRNTVLKGKHSSLIIELPAYHKPSFKRLIKDTTYRLKQFLWRACKLIIPVCVLLGGLNAINLQGQSIVEGSSDSVLAWVGQWLTPVFSPMGIAQDNWPATVGLLTGLLAKEVVVGSLNTLYSGMSDGGLVTIAPLHIIFALKHALMTIPENLWALVDMFKNPMQALMPDTNVSHSMFGQMVARFDGRIGAFAYLLFVLLYVPCISTMAAIRQETNRSWMWFSVLWSLFIAYFAAVLFYQLATISLHFTQTLCWIGLFVALFTLLWRTLCYSPFVTRLNLKRL